MSTIPESDWKLFKEIKAKALDKFCADALAEFKEIIEDNSKDAHERYLLHYRIVENQDKRMSLIFDGHSRSKAVLQLMAMRGEGLADEDLVSKMSDEMQKRTDPKNTKW